MEDKHKEETPTTVPVQASRLGENHIRWEWLEPSVWTPRMLQALQQGPKGGRWYSLMDKVSKADNLRAAWKQVKHNGGAPGVDHITIESFESRLQENLTTLAEELRSVTYRPQATRRVEIPKPGRKGETRGLGIPTVRDRVAQTAMKNVIEPIFEVGFEECSYGFRPGRGAKDALRQVNALLEEGYTHIVDADIRAYFDTIPHDALMEKIKSRISDGSILAVLTSWLNQRIISDVANWLPEEGTPQGAVMTPQTQSTTF